MGSIGWWAACGTRPDGIRMAGRKVIYSMFVSLDGFIEGPNKELDWHIVDEELHT